MTSPRLGVLRGALSLSTAALVAGCAVATQSVQLGTDTDQGHDPPRLTMTPAVIPGDGSALLQISDPTADSIALEAVNGVDRYSTRGTTLAVRVTTNFGEVSDTIHYAVRERGLLFDIIKRPIKITTCRQRRCQEYYQSLTVKLPERNERSVALTSGWATAFTKRAITEQGKSVLLQQVLNNSLWSIQAEVATHGLNARLQGYYNNDEHGGSLDLSQTFKSTANDVMGYGLAMHLAARRIDWLQESSASALQDGSGYQVSIGPSIMLKGLTASSQLGLYTDGHETLQTLSTFVSLNGNLTEIRSPLSVTLEKTFAFGGNAIIPRRRDGTERMTVGVQLTPNVALRVGMHSRRSAWPVQGTTDDIQVSEVYYSLGAQYTLAW